MKKYWQIHWHDSIDSTNLEAERWLRSGSETDLDILSVIAARWQYAGRGQGDRKWHSAAGMNLTFTVVERFGDEGPDAGEQSRASWATALAIVDYLASYGVEARIKLPNDIYVGDRKICGMLIQHHIRGRKLTDSIIGIGLDLNETAFPEELPNPTSLLLETAGDRDGLPYMPEEELEKLMEILSSRLDLSVSLSALEREFAGRLYTGRPTTQDEA